MRNQQIVRLIDGTPLQMRIDGPDDAPWIVLSNSVLTDLSIWDKQVAALATGYRVLRYDQRGHGGSGVPDGPMDFARYGADVIALLNACGVDRCTFLGLSMGAPTGLAAYAAAPDRFERFVVVDGVSRSAAGRAAFWTERRETAQQEGMERIANETAPRWMPGAAENGPEMARLRAMISATPVEGFAAATHALSDYDYSNAVSALACPFLGVTGEKDGAMPEAVRQQFAGVHGAQFTDIPGAGHLPNFQEPDAFNAVLMAFLSATAPDRSKETR